ncbi:Piso0_002010 [Millerozyma farinosa CBS 7064]|uniref:Piso0_002010 protein n=1 Tax=Pichia sorbitophila (strain ATCC MYA-4447 / BCRC 22081 / CBS 7064 / NBRC 10061 / NRRL Y-12695) TaxID=559304 RepID=G8YBG0_PICSO|nr:Piso0_002010 [Millerozyma farinosa CBS 7064]
MGTCQYAADTFSRDCPLGGTSACENTRVPTRAERASTKYEIQFATQKLARVHKTKVGNHLWGSSHLVWQGGEKGETGKKSARPFVLERWTVVRPGVGPTFRPPASPSHWTQIARLSPKPKVSMARFQRW